MQQKTISHNQCHMKNRCKKYETCPITLVHKLISGKWKILILWYLSNQTLRFSELRRKLPDITQRMLTNQLRSLEEDHLIFRKVYPVVPPKVEYGLTEVGQKLIPLLESMYSYGIDYSKYKPLLTDKDREQ
ncbi:MAG: winged helix-turn-helix transcriptional regulator [Cellulosilyticaceae bacterium]